jgi:hypothetical protein
VAEQQGGISWVQVVAGAGAAVASAVLLSTLGVAGTVVGAAVGSIAASVTAHLVSRGLDVSREQALALRRVGEAREDIERVASHPEGDAEPGLEHADVALGRLETDLRTSRRISWKHVAVVAFVLFVGVMVAITAFELLTGRAVSSYTGGSGQDTRTTVPGVKERNPEPSSPSPTSSTSPTPTPTVTDTPSSPPSTPTESPTPTDSPTASAQTPASTPTASP